MKWIVGLGNPGKRYEKTRHNLGFLVVDRFARRHGYGEFQEEFSSLVAARRLEKAGGDEVYLVKPQAYMNLSGSPVRDVLDRHGGAPGDLIVVHDDLDLSCGRLRYRARGSSGGHRGIDSIISALGTREFARLKLGIGREEGRETVDFVLSRPGDDEWPVLDRAVDRASESLDVWIAEGVERAALLFNGSIQEPDRESDAVGE